MTPPPSLSHAPSAATAAPISVGLGRRLLLLLLLAAAPAQAQVQDSTATTDEIAADAVAALVDSTVRALPFKPLAFPPEELGVALDTMPPVQRAAPSAQRALDLQPGVFRYDFGTLGWPDDLSMYGLPPHTLRLTLDGLPFEDLITGRPRFDLLPLDATDPLRWNAGATTVHTGFRTLSVREPLTEGRYHTSTTEGTQFVSVLHAQERPVRWFDVPGQWNAAFGIAGGRAQGAYPNDSVHRRRLWGRFRYQRNGWALELRDLHTRNRLGAHAGVVPIGDVLDNLYARLVAAVNRPDDRRQTLRNDLSARLVWQWHDTFPALDATVFWTHQITRFERPGTLYQYTADRTGLRVQQALPVIGYLRAAIWLDESDLADPTPGFDAAVYDTLAWRGLSFTAQVGGRGAYGQAYPTAAAEARYAHGENVFWLGATLDGTATPPAFFRHAYGTLTAPLDDATTSRLARARAGLRLRHGPFSVEAEAWAQDGTHLPDVFARNPLGTLDLPAADSVRIAHTTQRWAGAHATLGFRADAERGVYALLRPATSLSLTPDALWADALPRLHGEAHLGLRYLLFQGDLDLDASVRARGWSAFRSRTLHPATGLLALPPSGSRRFGPSGTLDVQVSAGIRTAAVFLAWENVLAQTVLYRGTLLVPAYPLAERVLRFGVYWPITG